MADLIITGSDVIVSGNTAVGEAGEAMGPGDTVYYDDDTNVWMLASAAADDGDKRHGIVVSGAVAAGQRVIVAVDAETVVTVGTVLTQGQVYVVSATAGNIAPLSDLVSTNYLYLLGYAQSTSELVLLVEHTGVAIP